MKLQDVLNKLNDIDATSSIRNDTSRLRHLREWLEEQAATASPCETCETIKAESQDNVNKIDAVLYNGISVGTPLYQDLKSVRNWICDLSLNLCGEAVMP